MKMTKPNQQQVLACNDEQQLKEYYNIIGDGVAVLNVDKARKDNKFKAAICAALENKE